MKSRNRRGQSLVLMMFILVVLIGVMALTLDFGFVLLSRRQMQTGVNTAAKEGLRGKGIPGLEYDDQARRSRARTVLQLSYDDDFDLSANDTTIGAGINSSLIQRDPDPEKVDDELYAYTIGPKDTTLGHDLGNRSRFVYRPNNFGPEEDDVHNEFQLNEGNDGDNDGEINVEGDMVAGNYNEADTEHREGPEDPDTEPPSYIRTDFEPTSVADTLDGSYDSFLVRMRRTHNPHSLDQIEDVSSRGGGLPLLLARGGWMKAEEPSVAYSVRRDGVTVRGTAIASAHQVKSVGVFDNSIDLPGASHVALEVGSWGIFPEAIARPVQIDAEGRLQTVAVAHMTSIVAPGSPAVVEVPASAGFPNPDGDPENYFTIQINDELITVRDINGTNWTVMPQPPTTSGQIRANESDVGVHLSLHLLANIPDGASTTIQVNASNDFVDPNGEATAAFQIQIDVDDASQIETLTVTDIDDDDPTLWTVVRGVNAGPHSMNEVIRIPFARALSGNVSATDTQISVHSVLTPIDPDGIPALYYLVKVDDETLRVTDISNDVNGFPTIWSVERGAPPAAHSADSQVRPVTSGAVIGMVRVGSAGIADEVTTEIEVDTSEALSSFRDPDNLTRSMYRVQIGNEVLRVRDIDDTDDTQWTVDRGVAGAASAHAADAVVSWSESVSFGDGVKPWAQYPTDDNAVRAQLSPPVNVSSFVPIYQPDSGQTYSNRVVAFGGALIDSTSSSAMSWDFPSSGSPPTRIGITIEKQASHVVVENGTATWPDRFARDLPTTEMPNVIEFIHAGHQRFDNAGLLAPALVRSIR